MKRTQARATWQNRLHEHFLVRLFARVRNDRVPQRAAALAFFTQVSFVPIAVVSYAIIRWTFGWQISQAFVQNVAMRFIPPETQPALHDLEPVLYKVDIDAFGYVGIATFLPIAIMIAREVDGALIDIFRAPARQGVLRLALYAAVVTLGPLSAVLGAQWTPDFGHVQLLDQHVFTFAALTLGLFVVFHWLPGRTTRQRHAWIGALVAALALEAGKGIFSIYATHLTHSLHLLWGTIAFVPLLLTWLLVTWFIVLLGAEIAAVLMEMERHEPKQRRAMRIARIRKERHRWRRSASVAESIEEKSS